VNSDDYLDQGWNNVAKYAQWHYTSHSARIAQQLEEKPHAKLLKAHELSKAEMLAKNTNAYSYD
jgi:hypothetical protein